jgi:3-oxoacyl-[acyl-carrier protein] reductase
MIPLGYAGSPEDAANGVYLFCSPESNYITGQTVAVAGNLQ